MTPDGKDDGGGGTRQHDGANGSPPASLFHSLSLSLSPQSCAPEEKEGEESAKSRFLSLSRRQS